MQIIFYHLDKTAIEAIERAEKQKRKIQNRIFVTSLALSFGALFVKLLVESIH